MGTVNLNNGSEEERVLVQTVMLSLKTLWNEGLDGLLAVYDLREISQGRGNRVSQRTIKTLQDLALVRPDGRVHTSVKNVVESALEGEGLETRLVSPIARPGAHHDAAHPGLVTSGVRTDRQEHTPKATSRLHSEERDIGSITVKASLGNLVHAEANALVVPQFLHCPSEGGVGYAIMSAGAERGVVGEYNAEHQRRGPFNFGEAFVTPSHGGPTNSLIHAISVGSGREREFSTVNAAVYNALAAADKAALSCVAFPMLGTGIIGTLDDRQSAQAMLKAVTDYANRNPASSIKSVELVVYGDPRSHARNPAYQALRRTLFDDVLPQVPIQEAGRREFDAERWARELQATAKRPEDKSFIQQVAERLGFGKRRLDS